MDSLIFLNNSWNHSTDKSKAQFYAVIQAAGASIQIAGDTLVNSSERLVVVTGSVDAVVRAIFHISDVMIQVRSLRTLLSSSPLYPVTWRRRH